MFKQSEFKILYMSGKASPETYTHRDSTKLYNPSTINTTEKELLSPSIWANKIYLVSGSLACTSSNPQIYAICYNLIFQVNLKCIFTQET